MVRLYLHLSVGCSSVHASNCGSGTPWCGGFNLYFSPFVFSKCCHVSMGDPFYQHVRHNNVLHAHINYVIRHLKVSHASWRNVVWYSDSITRPWEKYRSNSKSVTLLCKKCRAILFSVVLNYRTSFAKKSAGWQWALFELIWTFWEWFGVPS
jgi:hypothetical protein